MSKEKTETDRGPGPFRLLRRCEEVDPRLGRLYESWNVVTGRPALTLFPNNSVQWQPLRAMLGWLHFCPGPDSVSLELECQPDLAHAMDWVNLLTWLHVVGQQVEDSVQTQAHFMGQTLPPPEPPRGTLRMTERAWGRTGWALAGLSLLALGVQTWRHWPAATDMAAPSGEPIGVFLASAPSTVKLENERVPLVSYPLPGRPFGDQAVPPCETRKGAVEINSGCWVALEKKPPCFDTQAEYQGKCYLPVAKKEQPRQAVEP
ncbi:hypothetical protein [Archangium primigenium]|uniref:hypothetical protein n=1 Tax=[Archangium] primigenium TaxID=2792470 RepID=UPI0019587806|nr:hypothetical protein [Archangium primigenium]MBM7112223.1 hypothetical protein [Archangium primigenium]